MKIATWNINGIKARIQNLKSWLEEAQPDIACLQEIKSVSEGFPSSTFEDMGYNVVVHGQKSFNGVAILSKLPIEEQQIGLPGDPSDEQARFIEVLVSTPSTPLRIGGLYLPNGNPVDTEKYPYKLAWMERLYQFAKGRLELEEPFLLAGDYNIIPADADVHAPDAWRGDALFRPESHAAYRKLLSLGLTDALYAVNDKPGQYTFWDYQAGAWPKNNGIRIDHLLLSPEAADRLQTCQIDKHTRGWEKPSDHVPVWIKLDV
ncbi:exodeoxyribonuclease III [Coralliovum pocilloporae]|uniref:exodeoxyribonuclease III n=1 Tax=Coralliovum pocilloporae TaxID=3066369 RepID=UPI003306FC62